MERHNKRFDPTFGGSTAYPLCRQNSETGDTLPVIITSDFPSTENAMVTDAIKSVGGRIAWIPPASNPGRERFPIASERFKEFGLPAPEYFDIDTDSSPESLDAFDVLYLTGGDPLIFRQNLLRSGVFEALANGSYANKLIVGASGGSMQLTPSVSVFRLQWDSIDQVLSDRDKYTGLGLVDFEFLPHRNRSDEGFLETIRLYSEGVSNEIIALPDGGAVIVEEGARRIEGKYETFRSGRRHNKAVQRTGYAGR